ncbi:MAG: sugar transferase [Lautropia sp.]
MIYTMAKRVLDLTLSSVALMMLAPLLLPVVLILKFTGEKEVFFRQERLGYQNRPFSILKFATMLKDSPSIGSGDITVRGDPRVLPFGKFLRKWKLNELPQLINIILGDMSLVGPRPLMPISFEMYPENFKSLVYQSRPGLTGIASLVFRDEEALIAARGGDVRTFYRDIIYPYKGELEYWYQKNKSFTVDLQIIMMTAVAIFMPQSNVILKPFRSLPEPPAELSAVRKRLRAELYPLC